MKLTLLVKPGSKKESITLQKSLEGDVLKVSVKEPPVDGKANKTVIQLLSDFFDTSKSGINIKAGHSSRYKQVEIDVSEERIQEKLKSLSCID